MKVLFTADLHIKLGQKNVPVDWAKNRYSMLQEQLGILEKDVDLVILGGDIFDKLPNMDELDIYFKLISVFTKPTIIIDGNHEATKKHKTFFTQLKFVSQNINPLVTVVDDYFSLEDIDFIPYCKLKEFEKDTTFFLNPKKVLVTHVRGEIPPHVKPEVDLDIFNKWKVVLAGDLHSYENSQKNILYPGSPTTTSFHRNNVETGIIILDTATLEHVWHKLSLPQLIRKSIKAGDIMPRTDYDHTIYEIEGNLSELASIEDSDLLDKKVVKRSVDTALVLSADMSLIEEVQEYLLYILQLDDKTVEKTLKEFSNYAEKFSGMDPR